MAELLTIDASVFVAAYRKGEKENVSSRALLRHVREAGIPLIEPMLLQVEIAAALARAGEDSVWATDYAERVTAFPGMTLCPLDEDAAQRAVHHAAEGRLRGMDAVYVATACRFGASLVMLDREQLTRAPKAVNACTPRVAAKRIRKSGSA